MMTYFISEKNLLQMTLMDFRYVLRSHTSKIVIEQIVNIIKEYRIKKLLGYFVLDNIISNDTCVEAIFTTV